MAGTRDTLGALSYCPACARVQDLGAGKFGGKGGNALREAPPTHPTPPRPGGWEAWSVPGARAWPRRVPGCAPGAAGLEGLPPGLVSGAPFGLREPAGPGSTQALARARRCEHCSRLRWDPAGRREATLRARNVCAPKGDACPLQFCSPRRGEGFRVSALAQESRSGRGFIWGLLRRTC